MSNSIMWMKNCFFHFIYNVLKVDWNVPSCLLSNPYSQFYLFFSSFYYTIIRFKYYVDVIGYQLSDVCALRIEINIYSLFVISLCCKFLILLLIFFVVYILSIWQVKGIVIINFPLYFEYISLLFKKAKRKN